ncbi:MAG: NAD-dependent epimerase/dehydratase family protein [Pseudomonadota bacterium]
MIDWAQQQVLVTGGAGFVGQHVVRALLAKGARVVVLDDMSIGQRGTLAPHINLTLIEDTVADPVAVMNAMKGCTAVVHLAALVSVPLSVQVPERCFRSNVVGTETVLDAAYRQGLRGRILLASSAAVYGFQPEARPYTEAQANSAIPPTPYAVSKRINEQQAHMYRTCYGLHIHALRFFNIYGAGQLMSPTAGVLTRVANKLMAGEPIELFGDGLQLRDYVSVHDVVAVMMALLEKPTSEMFPAVLNVASGVATPLRAAMEMVAQHLGVEPRFKVLPATAGDVRYSCASIQALQSVLPAWEPTTLAQGLEQWLGQSRKSHIA